MAQRDEIPHLIQLLEDDSEVVREQVLRELLSFGPTLDDVLRELEGQLTPAQRHLVMQLVTSQFAAGARRAAWRQWPSLPTRRAQLERAFDLLAQFQFGWAPPVRVAELLDELADSFRSTGHSRDAIALNRYLFTSKRLQGDQDDYYNPMNSNLIYVLQEGKGLPISLVCIFMLVGERLGMRIEGCGVPGHYLARAIVNGQDVYIDCFSEGRLLTQREVEQLRGRLFPTLTHLLTEVPTATDIVRRVLRNLVNAYEMANETEMSALMAQLLEEVPAAQ
ncbi:MAG: transglutaminase family protein [Candidatus Hydrogenedentes bacterium]|nr:transglutaminase family protein [Candidatus Hydrogenedentota bacterium]